MILNIKTQIKGHILGVYDPFLGVNATHFRCL